jgi:capsular exopolysaccharide synthesis family protein
MDPHGPGADRFRFLRMRLRQLKQAQNVKTLLVTSPLPRDGKTTIVLNLATALAERGKRNVLVLEADLHRSSLCDRLGLQPKPGLAECLEDGRSPLSVLQYIQPLGWYFLGAGQAHGNPTELLHSNAVSSVMDILIKHFDWVLVDSPPVVPLSDALALKSRADASLLVVRAGATQRDAIETAIERLGPKHVAGIVLNGADTLDKLYSDYYRP